MQISQLTIHYTRTQSLPSYSNVKPGVTITATLEPGEDVFECYNVLMNDARELVHGEIDGALEQAGESPKFTEEPLYYLVGNKTRQIAAILPSSVSAEDLHRLDTSDPNYEHYRWRSAWNTLTNKMRYGAVSLAAADTPLPVLDCSDGDITRIPSFPAPPEPADEQKYESTDFGFLPDDDDDDRPENERFPDEEE